MIRQLEEREIPAVLSRTGDWQLFRLQALLCAYGVGYDFCRFYRQEEGNALLAVLDDSGILATDENTDPAEWGEFLRLAGLKELSLAKNAASLLTEGSGFHQSGGIIFETIGAPSPDAVSLEQAQGMTALKEVYELLRESFGLGAFDPWYCDLSHRIRSGTVILYRLAGQGCAMATLGEDRLFLSGVAVSPELRGQGVGSRMIGSILSAHPDKRVAVYSRNPIADRLYTRLGFRPIGRWCQLSRLVGNDSERNRR